MGGGKRWGAEQIQFLTQNEMRRLLASIKGKRDYALFLIAYRHGLRASEIGLLTEDDIDLTRGTIRVHRLKGSLGGVYPMQNDEIKAIRAMLRARAVQSPILFLSKLLIAVSRRQLDLNMKKYGEKAGIPKHKRHFHTLKHSIATHLLDAGTDIRFVQDWLGHKDIKNTAIYAQLTPHRRKDEARRAILSKHVV